MSFVKKQYLFSKIKTIIESSFNAIISAFQKIITFSLQLFFEKRLFIVNPKSREILNVEDYVISAQKGDEISLGILYKLYSKAMLNTSIRILKERHQAEDVMQEAFISAFRNINKLKDPKSFGGWLKRITINESLKHIRKSFLWVEVSDEMDLQVDSIEEEWWKDFDFQELLALITILPSGCRLVFNLFAIENLSHKQISDRLGISESTSKTQYRRAKHMLRNMAISQRKING
jgi:RNA polymerase sigma factor (sigma-70 family)